MQAQETTAEYIPISHSKLRRRASALFGKTIDWDMFGKPLTDVDTLLSGAYRMAVLRLVNLAVQRRAGVPITIHDLPDLADEAFAQAEDFDFAGGQITEYGILLKPSAYGRNVLNLVNLAIAEAVDLC